MVKNYTFEMLGLVSEDMDPAMLNIAELAARMLDAPASFVSVLEHQKARQYFSVCTGRAVHRAGARAGAGRGPRADPYRFRKSRRCAVLYAG